MGDTNGFEYPYFEFSQLHYSFIMKTLKYLLSCSSSSLVLIKTQHSGFWAVMSIRFLLWLLTCRMWAHNSLWLLESPSHPFLHPAFYMIYVYIIYVYACTHVCGDAHRDQLWLQFAWCWVHCTSPKALLPSTYKTTCSAAQVDGVVGKNQWASTHRLPASEAFPHPQVSSSRDIHFPKSNRGRTFLPVKHLRPLLSQ